MPLLNKCYVRFSLKPYNMTFNKQLIAFSAPDYIKAVADANDKVKLLYKALNFSAQYVMIENIDLKKFAEDCVAEFKRVFTNKWKVKYEGISADKLLMLQDVSISELEAIRSRINAIKQPIKLSKGKYLADVSKDTYSVFTRNEKENKLLAQVNNLKAVVDKIEQDNKVYKMTLAQSMPNVLSFNMITNEINMKQQHFR